MIFPKKLSNYSVPDEYLETILEIIKSHPIKNILDLGSGRTSIMFKKYCPCSNLISIESDEYYYNQLLKQCPELKSNLYLTEHIKTSEYSYYLGLDNIVGNLKFDLISIDGPIGYDTKQPRRNILSLIDNKNLNSEFFIILHDTDRSGEKWLVNEIFKTLHKNGYEFKYKYLKVPYGAILIYNTEEIDTIYCPCCNNKIDKTKLGPIGTNSPILDNFFIIGGGRRLTRCPNCFSSDRSRLIYLYLKSYDLNNKDILHVAPESELHDLFTNCNSYERICNFSEIYDTDLTINNVDICNMSCYNDNFFDLIICNHVLEHVEKEDLAISELHRVLKPGGILILQVPLAIGLKNTLRSNKYIKLDDPSHKRLYGDNYQDIIDQFGFSSEKIYLADIYSNCGLNPLEYINIFKKI